MTMAKEHAISRRDFMMGAAIGAAGLASFGISACAPQAQGEDSVKTAEADATESEVALEPAEQTIETDVAVIGLGTSGFQAAMGARSKGADVVVVDSAPDMSGTTNISTAGYLCVGDSLQKEQPFCYTVDDVYNAYNEMSNYTGNLALLRHMLEASCRSSQNVIDAGVEVQVVQLPEKKELTPAELGQLAGHPYMTRGQERADLWQAALDKVGITSMFNTTGEQLLFEDGQIVGVRCISDGKPLDIKAKAVVLCTGGFIGDEEMVAEYYRGAKVKNVGNATRTGSGIKMAISAGGHLGKNFSLCSSEFGATNLYAGLGNAALEACFFGTPLVDSNGERFMPEWVANKKAMHCAEPFIRVREYYSLMDQDFIEFVNQADLGDLNGDSRMARLSKGKKLEGLQDGLDQGVSEGWIFKADSIEELADAAGLENLVDTVQKYNSYCDAGLDELYNNPANLMHRMSTPPFYAVQAHPNAYCTLGGIMTDADCHVLDSDNNPLENLFMGGVDADIMSIPYVAGGSANGFSQASGLIAGETAGEYATSK